MKRTLLPLRSETGWSSRTLDAGEKTWSNSSNASSRLFAQMILQFYLYPQRKTVVRPQTFIKAHSSLWERVCFPFFFPPPANGIHLSSDIIFFGTMTHSLHSS